MLVGVSGIDEQQGVGTLFIEHAGHTVAAVQSHVKTPTVLQSLAESQVGDDADTQLEILDVLFLVGLVCAEAMRGEVGDRVAQRMEVTRGGIGTLVRLQLAAQRQVERGAKSGNESPCVASRLTPEKFHGDAQSRDILAFTPPVELGVEIIFCIGVVRMGKPCCGLGKVVDDLGIGETIVRTEPHAEMLAEEMSVVQPGVTAKPNLIVAILGAVGQGVDTAAQVETDEVPIVCPLCHDRDSQCNSR